MPTKNAKKVCAVSMCNNPKDVSYPTFPKNKEIQKIWVAKCRRSDSFNQRMSHICEHHFDLDAYERDLKAELLGLPPKKRLKKQAILSFHLPTGASPSCSEASLSHQNCQKKTRKRWCKSGHHQCSPNRRIFGIAESPSHRGKCAF